MANPKKYDWESLVHQAEEVEGENTAIHPAYEFSKKTFKEDDNAGVYNDNDN
jgi:hypothetical protein